MFLVYLNRNRSRNKIVPHMAFRSKSPGNLSEACHSRIYIFLQMFMFHFWVVFKCFRSQLAWKVTRVWSLWQRWLPHATSCEQHWRAKVMRRDIASFSLPWRSTPNIPSYANCTTLRVKIQSWPGWSLNRWAICCPCIASCLWKLIREYIDIIG